MKRSFGLAVFACFLALPLLAQDKEEPKKMEFKGKLRTGIVAIGGETTGTILETKDGRLELDLGKDKELRKMADNLNGKAVVVTGILQVRKGVEVKERKIITVVSLKAGEEK